MDTKWKRSRGARRTVSFVLSFILCVTSFIGTISTLIYLENYFNRGIFHFRDVYEQNDYMQSNSLWQDLGNAATATEGSALKKLSEKENKEERKGDSPIAVERKNLSNNDYFYYVQLGNSLIQTNGSSSVEDYASALAYADKMQAYYSWADGEHDVKPNGNIYYYSFSDGTQIVVGFPDEYLAQKETAYNKELSHISWVFFLLLVCVVVVLITFITSIITVGQRNPDGSIKINWFDRIFTEIQIIVTACALILGGASFLGLSYDASFSRYDYGGNTISINLIPFIISLIVGLAVSSIGLAFILSMVKNIKAKRFLRNSFLLKSFDSIKKVSFQWKDINRSIISFVAGIALCSMGLTMFILIIFRHVYWSGFRMVLVAAFVLTVTILPFYHLLKPHVKKYRQIAEGVHIVQSGNLEYKIPINGNSPLNQLADGINKISNGLYIAVDNEVKSERMKTALISNVSHDIKTPLTSMITYVDLLKREGLDSENAPKYLQILEEKTMRLKNLTEDLFEAAKASSGNLNAQIESVELTSLIQQALGEMDEKLRSKGLDIFVSGKKSKYYAYADGQLMWRVFENLFGNLVKYAQDNSRVYIDLDEISRRVMDDNTSDVKLMAVVVMKNISKYQLNISSSELMERFTRGDESRSSDGSGLGLSIAKDLMQIQNGFFDIQIDGDLFKAIIYIPAIEETEEQISPMDTENLSEEGIEQ